MANEIKKMRYFDGLFLKQDEFILEQNYHTEMRYRHNRYLHSCGIATGLEVSFGPGAKEVTVSKGMALNKVLKGGEELSQEIILPENSTVDLSEYSAGDAVYLYIRYSEVKADLVADKGGAEEIHWWEKAVIAHSETEPVDKNTENIILAKVVIKADGTIDQSSIITEENGRSLRIYAGFAGKAIETEKLILGIEGVATNLATIEGKLFGRPTQGVPGIQVNSPVTSFSGPIYVDGAIDLSGRVLGRDIAMDGVKLDSHVAATNNPHATTAAHVGALPITGGTVTGNTFFVDSTLEVNPGRVRVIGEGYYGIRLVTYPNTDYPNPSCVRALVLPVGQAGATVDHRAAVYANSEVANVKGLVAKAPSGTTALYVDGSLYVNGTSTFNGQKTGYVVDVFVNKSGQRLHTGDIVKLKGTPITRFQGAQNKIPVAEVTLADQENDRKVIGIVDCEAIPGPDSPDTRTSPDDPTCIEDGGELYVVTLGAYAHCKVDATGGPIEVGDLLTSSANPGFAKKAANPQIGTIIGKALEPLDSGTGNIAVFVNIQ